MAKLHRRVPRLPYQLALVLRATGCTDEAPESARRWSAPAIVRCACTRAAVVALALMLAISAAAQEQAGAEDGRLVRLEGLLTQLGSAEEDERRAAYDAITTLDADMVPAIRARLARVIRRRPDPDSAREVFNRIRHAAGSRRADDDIDIAPGVLPVLREERSERVMRMVEPLLLWRALEHIGTFEAGQAMYPLIGLDDGLWRWEERRVVSRMGTGIMAAAIAGRNHSERAVRQWASATMQRLHADEPGLAVQGLEPAQLADVLRAYAMLRMQSAMRVIVSYVGSERRIVRRAARWAIEQYGANAIWVLRTEYHVKRGEHAPEQWGWRRVAQALYAHADAQRLEPVRRGREEGIAALQAGELGQMRARFGEVLARAPEIDEPGPVAEGYAELAARASSVEQKAWAYRRALRLAPEHGDGDRWRAELAFLEVEQSLARGVLDEAQLRAVVGTHPEHEGAARLLQQVTANADEPVEDRTTWALFAALLFAMLGGALLWRGPQRPEAEREPEDDRTLPEHDATLSDSTLPG